MGRFLNSKIPFESWKIIRKDPYYVDKSELLCELIPCLDTENRFLCITRPRRFGKSVMANMIASFFGKSSKCDDLFENLSVAQFPFWQEICGKYNVIFIDFSEVPRDCANYRQYIARIQNGINNDLSETFKQSEINVNDSVSDCLNTVFQDTGEKFIFVIDEWDAVFHMPFIKPDEQKMFLLFLKNLLKGQPYVKLAYMTGILPIAKYSGGSELNMFAEYDMASRIRFGEYFGFLDSEVDSLYKTYLYKTKNPQIKREDLTIWYNGYHTASGRRVYNPRSVICSLIDNQINSYWTNSGPYDEIFYYVKHDINGIRDDLALMISGEKIEIRLQGYAAAQMQLTTKSEIYSAMVVYGLLTYEDGSVMIPNRELMEKFEELLLTNDSLGYIHELAKISDKMLKATLCKDTDTMSAILEYAHNTESPIFSYNNETELSAVVNLVYLGARDKYRIEREDKAGKGFADFIFYPEHKEDDAIILELKINSTPDEAIKQIREKKYDLSFSGKLGEKIKYSGRILAVGISYDKKAKKHFCKVEELQ